MKNKTQILKLGKESFDRQVSYSKKMGLKKNTFPIKWLFLNPITHWDKFEDVIFKIDAIGSLAGGMAGWYKRHEQRSPIIYLDDMEKYIYWILENYEHLEQQLGFDFKVQWGINEDFVYETAYLIDHIKNNLKPHPVYSWVKVYEFETPNDFFRVGYVACQAIGLGYEFRSLEKELPIPFNRFKDMQYTSKVVLDSKTQMNYYFEKTKQQEVDKWLSN